MLQTMPFRCSTLCKGLFGGGFDPRVVARYRTYPLPSLRRASRLRLSSIGALGVFHARGSCKLRRETEGVHANRAGNSGETHVWSWGRLYALASMARVTGSMEVGLLCRWWRDLRLRDFVGT